MVQASILWKTAQKLASVGVGANDLEADAGEPFGDLAAVLRALAGDGFGPAVEGDADGNGVDVEGDELVAGGLGLGESVDAAGAVEEVARDVVAEGGIAGLLRGGGAAEDDAGGLEGAEGGDVLEAIGGRVVAAMQLDHLEDAVGGGVVEVGCGGAAEVCLVEGEHGDVVAGGAVALGAGDAVAVGGAPVDEAVGQDLDVGGFADGGELHRVGDDEGGGAGGADGDGASGAGIEAVIAEQDPVAAAGGLVDSDVVGALGVGDVDGDVGVVVGGGGVADADGVNARLEGGGVGHGLCAFAGEAIVEVIGAVVARGGGGGGPRAGERQAGCGGVVEDDLHWAGVGRDGEVVEGIALIQGLAGEPDAENVGARAEGGPGIEGGERGGGAGAGEIHRGEAHGRAGGDDAGGRVDGINGGGGGAVLGGGVGVPGVGGGAAGAVAEGEGPVGAG